MHKFIQKVERFAKNPHLEAIIGIVILATGLVEAGDTLVEDITSGNVGAHHGMILLGFAHAFKAIPAILGGMAIFAHAEERE
jgi:hypothetical protein|tara:strand:- start:348 stop:593 length:246 start_codon:yes stop_codon:yes gene_type:complete